MLNKKNKCLKGYFSCQACATSFQLIQRELVVACHYRTKPRSLCYIMMDPDRKKANYNKLDLVQRFQELGYVTPCVAVLLQIFSQIESPNL